MSHLNIPICMSLYAVRSCGASTRTHSLIAPDDLRSIRVAIKIGERFERADVDPVHGEPVHVYGIHRPSPALVD